MKRHRWLIVPAVIALGAWHATVGEIASSRDFLAYREAAQILPYGRVYGGGYIYPPTFAWLFGGLAALPHIGAARLWYLGNIAALTASLYWVCRLAGLRGWWVWLPFLGSLRFVNNTFRAGQVNVGLLFLVALSAWLVARREREAGPDDGRVGRWREGAAGAALALAAVIKVWPGLFLVTHLLRRRWRVAAAGAAAGVVLLLLPAVTLGPLRLVEVLGDWGSYALSPYLRPAETTPFEIEDTGYIPGQSIRAMVHRLTRPIDATSHDDEVVPLNLFRASRGTAQGITLALTLGLAALYAWSLGRRGRLPAGADPAAIDRRVLLETAATVLFIFVLSPYVRKGHASLLLIPFAAAVGIARDPDTPVGFRRATWIALALAFGLGSLSGRFLLPDRAASIAEGASAVLWGNVVLLVWVIAALRREGAPMAPDAPPPRAGPDGREG